MTERGDAPATGTTLARAVLATRRSFDGESERAPETERLILESMRRTTPTRKVFWLAPLAAAFLVPAAFAGELGERIAALKTELFTDDVPAEAASTSARERLAASSATPATPATSAPAPTAAEPIPTQSGPSGSSVARAEPKASTSVRPLASSRDTTSESVDELAFYKDAHRAHFVDRDYVSALAGWDRYLALAPRGTFALEARYNRAIALHRLGRRTAALEALRPFADGAYGHYRRDEARKLIEELR